MLSVFSLLFLASVGWAQEGFSPTEKNFVDSCSKQKDAFPSYCQCIAKKTRTAPAAVAKEVLGMKFPGKLGKTAEAWAVKNSPECMNQAFSSEMKRELKKGQSCALAVTLQDAGGISGDEMGEVRDAGSSAESCLVACEREFNGDPTSKTQLFKMMHKVNATRMTGTCLFQGSELPKKFDRPLAVPPEIP